LGSAIAASVIKEFLEELAEMVERISLSLTSLEKTPEDKDLIRSLYRDVHTIKGNSMMFGLPHLGRLAHSMENVLEIIRERELAISQEIIHSILTAIDLFIVIANGLRETGLEPEVGDHVNKLLKLFDDMASQLTGAVESPIQAIVDTMQVSNGEQAEKSIHSAESVSLPPEQASPSTPPSISTAEEPRASATKISGEDAAQESIRVNVKILDKLMNLVGELVLVRNQYQERAKVLADEDLHISQRLNLVTAELQHEVMKTRMQPVGNILNKFHRVVRDLSRELNKEIELQIIGADTELDKALLEAIRDPLMHIVRNSVDHGIELPEIRQNKGKSKAGLVQVQASQQGGQVVIEITDDGKGLDREQIRSKAIEKGLITPQQATQMSEKEIFNLIFNPGFSTAEKVSNVSGRGVGMDVVKTNIERIGGTVEVQSSLDQGSTTVLRIPLTLAIMPALLIRAGISTLAIPQSRLIELIRIDQSEGTQSVEMLEGKPFFRLRGNLLPLVVLTDVLSGIHGGGGPRLETYQPDDVVNVAVVDGDGIAFGLIVDNIEDSIDIVIKPLGQTLGGVGIFSGATVLGDGNIALLLDVGGMAAITGVRNLSNNEKTAVRSRVHGTAEAARLADEIDYLVVELDAEGEFVIPTCNINRLEEFARDDLHVAGDCIVVKYRDGLLPILSVASIVAPKQNPSPKTVDQFGGKISVVVVNRGEKFYGLHVKSIVDIVTSRANIESSFNDLEGLSGSFIHQDSVFVVVDVFQVIDRQINPYHASGRSSSGAISANSKARSRRSKFKLLLAEDSNFFRKQILSALSEAGYEVSAYADGQKAWDSLSKAPAASFDLIVSDIEMPELDGLGLIQKIRESTTWKDTPSIAVTSKFTEKDLKVGLDAGFNQYMQKLNRDELIAVIDQFLGVKG
jgi:two-component system, chemotaxis family, sensor kinase CheA